MTNTIYRKTYTYKDREGKESSLELRPLNPLHLGKLLKVAGKLRGLKKDKDESEDSFIDKALAILDESTTTLLVELCLDTIKRSSPDKSVADCEDFVSTQFFELFPVVVEYNLPNGS